MGSLAIGATNSLVAKIGTKDFATFCSVYRFWTSEQILIFKVSKRPYRSPHMIGSLASSATSSLVAKKWTKNISQPFEELQGSNSEFKLITPKPNIGTYF